MPYNNLDNNLILCYGSGVVASVLGQLIWS